jgi:hypothetical protein
MNFKVLARVDVRRYLDKSARKTLNFGGAFKVLARLWGLRVTFGQVLLDFDFCDHFEVRVLAGLVVSRVLKVLVKLQISGVFRVLAGPSFGGI